MIRVLLNPDRETFEQTVRDVFDVSGSTPVGIDATWDATQNSWDTGTVSTSPYGSGSNRAVLSVSWTWYDGDVTVVVTRNRVTPE